MMFQQKHQRVGDVCSVLPKSVYHMVSVSQNSVFECNIDWKQFIVLQSELMKIINTEEDSLRFYNLGNNYTEKVIHVGIKPSIDLEGELII